LIGCEFIASFTPYGVIGAMFMPIFRRVLEADLPDEDLLRRCFCFLEEVLSGEEHAAEGVLMMVIDDLSSESASRALAYAGPLFVAELRRANRLGLEKAARKHSGGLGGVIACRVA
jgi:hypothetical protein